MRKLRQEDGLTLIEVIIALVLLFALVGAFAGAMLVGLQSEAEVDIRMEANNLASAIIEYIKDDGLPAGTNTENGEEVINLIDFRNESNIDEEEDLFFSELNLTNSKIIIDDDFEDIDGFDNVDHLYKIIVELEWQERNEERTLRLVSLFAGDPED